MSTANSSKPQMDKLNSMEVEVAGLKSDFNGLRGQVTAIDAKLGAIFEKLDRGRSIPWPAVAIFVSVIAMAAGLANAYFGRGIEDAQNMSRTAHDRQALFTAQLDAMRDALTSARLELAVEKTRMEAVLKAHENKTTRLIE